MAKPKNPWDDVYRAFQPYERLVGQRSRDLYCEREHTPLELMLSDFRPVEGLARPPIAYLTGLRGSGKSSLLLRFLEHFRDEYFVVYFDVEFHLDTATAHEVDLLYLLGACIFQTGVDEGLKPDKTHLEKLADSVYALTETKTRPQSESLDVVALASKLICLGSGAFGGSLAEKAAEKLTQGMRDSFKLSSGVEHKVVAEHKSEPQIQKIVNNVNLILGDAKLKNEGERDILVVVDGLDKLSQPGQARKMFLESRALLGPRCRLVYTVPISIYKDISFGEAEQECSSYLLPNVKLYEKGDRTKKYRRGYEMLREVVRLRLRSADLEIQDVLTSSALDLLIVKSGGVLRWLVELVKDASNLAYQRELDKINLEIAREAVTHHRRKLSGRLDTQLLKDLDEVRQSHRLPGGPRAGELLQSRFIAPYYNGEAWYDVHPIIWEVFDE